MKLRFRVILTLSPISLGLFLSLLLLELHVAEVHDGSSQLVDAVLLFLGKAQHIERFLQQMYRAFKISWQMFHILLFDKNIRSLSF